jgi:hypothetical protein
MNVQLFFLMAPQGGSGAAGGGSIVSTVVMLAIIIGIILLLRKRFKKKKTPKIKKVKPLGGMMRKEEVDTFVNRMNMPSTPKSSGFDSCSVISYEPIIIAYDFDSGPNADNYIMSRQILLQTYSLKIDPKNICRVLEER